jgi:hypothetical protein
MADGVLGYGAKLYYGTAGATATTELTLIMDISGPKVTAAKIDETTHTQTVGEENYTRQAPGLKTSDDISMDILYACTQSATLFSLVGVEHSFKILYPDTSYDSFDGFISEAGKETPVKENMKNNIVITPKSIITNTPA